MLDLCRGRNKGLWPEYLPLGPGHEIPVVGRVRYVYPISDAPYPISDGACMLASLVQLPIIDLFIFHRDKNTPYFK